MRYSAEHKIETRKRIVDAASRLFRRDGYGGSGIDGLTREAGVTNGAFYGHFKSKGEAFRTVVLAGLEQLRLAVADLKTSHGKRWLKTFIGLYLGPKRTCDIGESCALPSFSPEMVRADAETREAYETELRRLIESRRGCPTKPARRATTRRSRCLRCCRAGSRWRGRYRIRRCRSGSPTPSSARRSR
ncbi:TetR/AcrR family transcriptional regulator [Paraburkholderia sp. CNPSo 3274]|uniref:TetR/AcrR family transcriptional regulator n=1 Tax=Paraburkholderia sp. CNPSo 3274 TaxID=2940932 RepID=UPI0020B6CCDA|nr:TetR/AcrR family transcriptional regulator [Paraburkholderia sp. CNPSo 3274]MCP3711137.1 TetR/AcrR family transcriptional regulator [Paraburkholderia sp. CNPSo 3274]